MWCKRALLVPLALLVAPCVALSSRDTPARSTGVVAPNVPPEGRPGRPNRGPRSMMSLANRALEEHVQVSW